MYYVPRRTLPLKKYRPRGPRTKKVLPNPRVRARSSMYQFCTPDLLRWSTDEISGWTGALSSTTTKWNSTQVAANHTQTFTDSTSPKYIETSDVIFDGENVDFSYPAYKPVTNLTRVFNFTPGVEFVQSGSFPQGDRSGFRRITYHGNPVFLSEDAMIRSTAVASKYGLCLTPDAILTQVSSIASTVIKNKLLEDGSLLNFRDTFSILTFFAELGDLRSLPSLLKKWTRTSHDVSDKYLGVSFGVLPFYSDICSILNRLNNLGPEIDRWNEMAQTCEVRNFHINIPITGLIGTKNSDLSYSKSYRSSILTRIGDAYMKPTYNCCNYADVVQTASAKGHVYLIPRAIPEHLINELRAKIWGTDSILGTAWEKLPFSFVVDWFTGIGKVIHEFEKSGPLLQYRVLNAGFSLRVDTVITSCQGRTFDDSDFGALTSHERFYTRVPLDPQSLFQANHNYGLEFKLLNTNQTLLGTALIHQFLR